MSAKMSEKRAIISLSFVFFERTKTVIMSAGIFASDI